MSKKRIASIITDVLMSVVLILLLSYSIAGELVHEILGISMFALFFLHHILSFPFTKGIIRGKRTAIKNLKLITDILLCVLMLLMMLSAIQISSFVFGFLGVRPFASVGRTVHLFSAYWLFCLIGFHIGLHLDVMLGKALKSRKGKIISALAMSLCFASGMFFFVSEGLYKYMFLISRFAFIDPSASLPLFFVKYLLILSAFSVIGFAVLSALKNFKNNNNK